MGVKLKQSGFSGQELLTLARSQSNWLTSVGSNYSLWSSAHLPFTIALRDGERQRCCSPGNDNHLETITIVTGPPTLYQVLH